MEINVFVSKSPSEPRRWKEAFPEALVVTEIPFDVPQGSIVWLHEMLPVSSIAVGVRFVVMYDEPTEDKGLTALAQGASGYCNTHAAPELLHTIELAIRSNDGLWVGESLLNRLLSSMNLRSNVAGSQHTHPALEALSERERQIALLIAQGDSNKTIANQMFLAERTIKAHISIIFKKLEVKDRLQLAVLLNTPAAVSDNPQV